MVVLLIGAGSSPAWSQAPDRNRIVKQVRVPIGDLDLSRSSDADILLQRLSHAAARACGRPSFDIDWAAAKRANRACRADAVSRVVADLDAPMVDRRYAESSGVVQLATARR